jgi:hypothetical protein
MFNKFFSKVFLFIIILCFIYLIFPEPAPLAPLPQSLKSVEPGDTTQIPGISAYYTNLSRQEVIDFYQNQFSHSSFLDIPLITYRLNHPPEMSRDLIRTTQQSSYLEEIVHPLRESLFVSGFEWENDPFTKVEKRPKNKLVVDKIEYKAKITLIQKRSHPLVRILVSIFSLILFCWWEREVKQLIINLKTMKIPFPFKK